MFTLQCNKRCRNFRDLTCSKNKNMWFDRESGSYKIHDMMHGKTRRMNWQILCFFGTEVFQNSSGERMSFFGDQRVVLIPSVSLTPGASIPNEGQSRWPAMKRPTEANKLL